MPFTIIPMENSRFLADFSHIHVFYWFDQNDTPENRNILQLHPRKNPSNPLTGVFATHAPVRPNLIAHTICKCLAVKGLQIFIDDIDARDASPVIDIKCYIPGKPEDAAVKVPAWVQTGR